MIPVVPIRRKFIVPYKNIKIILTIPSAARCALLRWPISIVSTADTRGTEILLIIFGMARERIFLFICDFLVNYSKLLFSYYLKVQKYEESRVVQTNDVYTVKLRQIVLNCLWFKFTTLFF